MSRRAALALLLGVTTILGVGAGAVAHAATQPSGRILSLTLNGVVDPFEASYLKDGIAKANAESANAVLITVDTPGGLDSSMRQITQAILGSSVPVICYVAPSGARAASAGTFVMYSCPLNAMAPGTNIGAAHPVGVSGVIEETKVTNDAAAYIRSLADATGRNADWAEEAVRDSVSIPAEEAVKIGVVDLIAPSQEALLQEANGRTVTVAGGSSVTLVTAGVPVEPLSMSWGAALLHGLFNPNLAFLFFYLGLGLIVVEILHPGISVPGILGTVLLVISFVSFGFLPVQAGGVVLLIASAVFFLLEFKHPGLGLPTLGGVVCLVLGGVLLFDRAVPNAAVSPWLIAVVAMCTALFFAFVVKAALAVRHRPVVAGEESLVGSDGVAITELGPRGSVRVNRESWTAETDGEPIAAGAPVRVVDVRGVRLVVAPVPNLPADGETDAAGREPAGHAAGPEGGTT